MGDRSQLAKYCPTCTSIMLAINLFSAPTCPASTHSTNARTRFGTGDRDYRCFTIDHAPIDLFGTDANIEYLEMDRLPPVG